MAQKTPAEMPYILFVPHMDTSLFEMLDIAIAIKKRGKYTPIFLIRWQDHQRSVDACLENGIDYQFYGVSKDDGSIADDSAERNGEAGHPNSSVDGLDAKETRLQSVLGWVKSRIKEIFILQFVLYLLRFSRINFGAKSLLRDLHPACLLLMGDRHVGIETALVRFANEKGLPSLIVPFGLSETAGLAKYRLSQPEWENNYGMSKRINRLIARYKPLWCSSHGDTNLLWNIAPWMLAAEVVGIMPGIPWSLGGGGGWLMAVENDYHKNNFKKQSTPEKKMVVVGKPRYDRAAQIWMNQPECRSQICASLSINLDIPLLVCAVPQMAEHEFLTWPEHWKEIDFLFDSFSQLQPDVNIVLSLHPKSDFAKYSPRAEKYGLTIARNQSYDQLITVCDVFVATYSSTVSLAIAAQKPTIVIDFYGFNTDLFRNVEGIVVVKQHEQFVPTLKRFFSDQDYYNQLVEGQAQAAKIWARFDGKATPRILDLIDELVEQGKEIQKLPKRERRKALPPWSQ